MRAWYLLRVRWKHCSPRNVQYIVLSAHHKTSCVWQFVSFMGLKPNIRDIKSDTLGMLWLCKQELFPETTNLLKKSVDFGPGSKFKSGDIILPPPQKRPC